MRKTVLSALIVALLLGITSLWPAQAASAKDAKPLAVVSLSGYDELIGDVEMVGKLSGTPDLAKWLEGTVKLLTKGKGLAGLDKKRPWGAVVQIEGDRLSGYGFVPVTDLKQLMEVLKPYLGKVKNAGDGVFEVQTKRRTLYVKQKGGWAFVCDRREALANAPANPGKLIAGLNQRYDLALRLNVCNVPKKHREKLIARLERHLAKHLERRSGEDEKLYAVRKKLSRRMLESIVTAINDLEQITLGWSLDHDVEKALLELSITAQKGTKTAGKLAKLAQTKTGFGGFRVPGAAVTGHLAGKCSFADPADLAVIFDSIRSGIFEEIDAKEHSKEKAKVAKEVVEGLLEVARKTIASGRIDGAMALVLRPEAATLVAGRYIADGPKLEKTLGLVVKAVRKKHPDFVEKVLKTNADEYKGVRFHVLSIPVHEKTKDRDKVVQLVGEKLEVVLGIAPEAVYLAAGKDAIKTLKQAIERSEAKGFQTVPPMELSIALGTIAKFAAEIAEQKHKHQVQKALAALEKAPGKDHVTLVALPIERGVKLRLEVEEGVLKAIGAIRKKR